MEFVENIRWRRGEPIDEMERNCILLYSGMNYTDQQIAQMLGRDITTVRQWLKRFYETGKMHAGKTSGRRRKTTREEDLDIVFAANENPFRTRLEIREASGVHLTLK